MPQRTFTRAYADPDADYTVEVAVDRGRCRISADFRRFPIIRDAISGEAVAVDAGDNFESLLELMRELVVEACADEARGDRVMLGIVDAYRARRL